MFSRIGRREALAQPAVPEAFHDRSPAANGPTSRPSAEQLLSATGGVPLPGPVLQRMQHAFGTGFGRVRVHRGPEAEAFDAAAFTVGERIFMPPSAPSLHSEEGQALLGHELTHVLQQRHGRVRAAGQGIIVDPHPHLEAEAVAAGEAISRGESPQLVAHPRAGRSVSARAPVQRLPSLGSLARMFRGRRSEPEEEGIELKDLGSRAPQAKPGAPAIPLAPVAANDGPSAANANGVPRAEATAEPVVVHVPAAPAVTKPEPADNVSEATRLHVAKQIDAHAKTQDAKQAQEQAQAAAEKSNAKAQKRAAAKAAREQDASEEARRSDAGRQLSEAAQARNAGGQQLIQTLAGGAELAQRAEESGKAYPPAPDPSVDWAQAQPVGDSSLPPPLQIPERAQPEPQASIRHDPPLSVMGPLTLKHERAGMEHRVMNRPPGSESSDVAAGS